jgi:bifunctional ADP-heptose synthase (sugar kinase/adenylyltransferase)
MKVFTAGCFDVLSVGHFNLLMFCRQLAGPNGEVYVSLDTDLKIMIDKGEARPIFSFRERREAIEAIKMFGKSIVDYTKDHDNNEDLQKYIDWVRPDAIVVGSDYINKIVVGGGEYPVHYFERDHRFSSTEIIERCLTSI